MPNRVAPTFKSRLRGLVPVALWSRTAKLTELAFDGVAATANFVLRVLPEDVRMGLKDRLVTKQRLDYADANIMLRVTTRAERRLRVHSCEKEPETVDWLEELHDGDVLYDIGANVGAYSLIAASLPGRTVRVYAFEPGTRTFESLCANIEINALGRRIVPLPVALTDVTGVTRFEYASSESGAARHPGLLASGNGTATAAVMGFRLDDLVKLFQLPAPTHVKVDVDGSELLVLRGATETIASPATRSILVETSPDTAVGSGVREMLEAAGYKLRSVSRRGGYEANWVFSR